jgi:hypothetical protein
MINVQDVDHVKKYDEGSESLLKEYWKKIGVRNLIGMVLLIFATLSYWSVLEECPLPTEHECVNNYLKPRIKKIATRCAISSCLYIVLFLLCV